jgi:DNA-binding Xre family transcriptional regulator
MVTKIILSRELDVKIKSIDFLYHKTAIQVDLRLIDKLCQYLEYEEGDIFILLIMRMKK